ncbi:hypothetical protein EHS13_07810 [Paenibacillus psychroresistens]|uniref:Excalibur calcium-binding domain-containing protein n=1 Tax=Paenibacillus psychroresistens TaxID=1778678 RepID=A0A6B8RYK0_9BACL|nr:hypothetical protein EHS13_07810 [Paenibacillus psychroresistens]
MVNGKASTIDVKVIDNVNYVPLNSFAASLGYDVSTNTKTNTIAVALKKSTPKPTPKATPKPTPKTALIPTSPPTQMDSVYYQNCTAVRAAGKDPLYRGDPGYSTKLDRDKDGVACE